MTQVSFYNLIRDTLESVLPKILEKAMDNDIRALIITASDERSQSLDEALWAYDADSFLPHGRSNDSFAQDQPILITNSLDNKNDASLLVIVDGVDVPNISEFDRCIEIFYAEEASKVDFAKDRRLKSGYKVKVFQQEENGSWETSEYS